MMVTRVWLLLALAGHAANVASPSTAGLRTYAPDETESMYNGSGAPPVPDLQNTAMKQMSFIANDNVKKRPRQPKAFTGCAINTQGLLSGATR
jgi:hypothetical protein